MGCCEKTPTECVGSGSSEARSWEAIRAVSFFLDQIPVKFVLLRNRNHMFRNFVQVKSLYRP